MGILKLLILEITSLVILSSGKNFLSRWLQQNRVLVLGDIGSRNVAKRWVWVHESSVTELLESQIVLLLSEVFDPSLTPGKSSEVIVDQFKESLGGRVSEWDSSSIEFLHVVTALHVLSNVSLSGRSEGLNSVDSSLRKLDFKLIVGVNFTSFILVSGPPLTIGTLCPA